MYMEDNIFNFGGSNEEEQFDPATESQKALLVRKGYNGPIPINQLTKQEAHAIISELTSKEEETKEKEVAKPQKKTPAKNEVAANTSTSVAEVKEKNISDSIINQLTVLQAEQGLELPTGYNPTNALKSAYLKLAENNLLESDKTALAQALLNMCIQGLNPAKNQCYFISYGGKVSMMRSYFGDVTAALNTGLVKSVQANIIYEGDEVELETDNLGYIVVKHHTSWENYGGDIVGAYAFADLIDGRRIYDIMKIDRIKKSWAMSKNNTNNKLQRDFTDDACRRTVIRHLVKKIFNETTDNNLIVESYNTTTEDEYIPNEEYKENTVIDVHTKQQANNGTKVIKQEDTKDFFNEDDNS